MRLQLQFAVDDEMLRAQHHERFLDAAEVGGEFLHDAAEFLEAAHGALADLAGFAVDRQAAAVIGRVGDALAAASRSATASDERVRRRIEGQRIERAQPAMVSRNSARSGMLRAIGPCTDSGEHRLFDGPARHPARRGP